VTRMSFNVFLLAATPCMLQRAHQTPGCRKLQHCTCCCEHGPASNSKASYRRVTCMLFSNRMKIPVYS
jgi:hypothetical protein